MCYHPATAFSQLCLEKSVFFLFFPPTMPLPVSHTEYFYSKLTNVFSEAYTAVLSLKSKRIYYAVLVNIWLTLPAPPAHTHKQYCKHIHMHKQIMQIRNNSLKQGHRQLNCVMQCLRWQLKNHSKAYMIIYQAEACAQPQCRATVHSYKHSSPCYCSVSGCH